MLNLAGARWLRLALLGVFVFALIHSAQVSREATLAVTIVDAATGERTPVRVLLEGADGTRPKASGAVTVSESAIPIPEGAVPVLWGRSDRAEGYALQPDGSFYADGSFSVTAPAGEYRLRLSKGNEYLAQEHRLTLEPGDHVEKRFALERWINMPAKGWYSADDHVHLQRSPRDNPSIAKWIAAEDVHVGHILEMGDFWATYFTQHAFGKKGRYQEGDTILSPGQEEPRTPEIGHTISLGAEQLVRFRNDYYSYGRLFDRVDELGGVSGFAHQGMSFHGYRGMTLDVLRGKVDFLELAQFCVPDGPIEVRHYYHFLDLGFRLTALAGSDWPWCGRGQQYGIDQPRFSQIGDARFYTYVGGALTFEGWIEAVKAGRTFATTGPVVLLEVNGLGGRSAPSTETCPAVSSKAPTRTCACAPWAKTACPKRSSRRSSSPGRTVLPSASATSLACSAASKTRPSAGASTAAAPSSCSSSRPPSKTPSASRKPCAATSTRRRPCSAVHSR